MNTEYAMDKQRIVYVGVFIHASLYIPIYPCIIVYTYLSIHHYICIFIHSSLYIPIYPFIILYTYLSIHLCISILNIVMDKYTEKHNTNKHKTHKHMLGDLFLALFWERDHLVYIHINTLMNITPMTICGKSCVSPCFWNVTILTSLSDISIRIGEVGGWGRVPFSRNLMSPTPRRK